MLYRFKMAAKCQTTNFYFASFRFWPKFEKPPKELFNEIWLKVGEHE